jgi:hypothetical protein
MNDQLIRTSFHRQLSRRYRTSADTLILDELGLCHGKCRADIAVVNGSLTGFEIKSDEDSLERLGEQIKAYGAVFDRASVITTMKHRDAVIALLPRWWGLIICKEGRRGGVRFEIRRKPAKNRHVDPVTIAKLLWKTETAQMLVTLGEQSRISRERRALLYERLAAMVDLADLKRRVRECLKRRKNWRGLSPLSPSGG